jgi:hypothetical protein
MTLKGEARTGYMRNYMRRRRAEAPKRDSSPSEKPAHIAAELTLEQRPGRVKPPPADRDRRPAACADCQAGSRSSRSRPAGLPVLEWQIEVDDGLEGYLTAHVFEQDDDRLGLYVYPIGDVDQIRDTFFWRVAEFGEEPEDDDKDAPDPVDLAKGRASSLVAAMAAAEAAAAPFIAKIDTDEPSD